MPTEEEQALKKKNKAPPPRRGGKSRPSSAAKVFRSVKSLSSDDDARPLSPLSGVRGAASSQPESEMTSTSTDDAWLLGPKSGETLAPPPGGKGMPRDTIQV
jgi:hypothetical protein